MPSLYEYKKNNEPVIVTYSGKLFNVFAPTSHDICIEDIAHALSNQCRFGGHLPKFFSVAQHSLLVSSIVAPEHRLAALLHDASEAYLIDVPRPIKLHLSNYKDIEDVVMSTIARKYGFQWPLHEEIKKADEIMLQREWDEIMMGRMGDYTGEPCYPPGASKRHFLERFKLLCKSEF